ncbi:hypothetical protein [Hydrogenophaga pseudoflava]|uniref:Uncharacterized protein n=1 Tax=Hydrogenophaga pseudoflava TaxID=47421 RepID=A0A4P6X7Y2_HYDPS|nr:hypothetical protein [Hydrogenophaga pseudoflava]QBM30658.1 hypothetical protein HPF_23420 [Hydrogenophaga pseudoflava]
MRPPIAINAKPETIRNGENRKAQINRFTSTTFLALKIRSEDDPTLPSFNQVRQLAQLRTTPIAPRQLPQKVGD